MDEKTIIVTSTHDDDALRETLALSRTEKAANILHSVFGLAAGASPEHAAPMGKAIVKNLLHNMFPPSETDWVHDPARISKAETKRLRKQAKRAATVTVKPPAKGELNGVCAVTSCSYDRAIYYNRETQKHYCVSCARRINESWTAVVSRHNRTAGTYTMDDTPLCKLASYLE